MAPKKKVAPSDMQTRDIRAANFRGKFENECGSVGVDSDGNPLNVDHIVELTNILDHLKTTEMTEDGFQAVIVAANDPQLNGQVLTANANQNKKIIIARVRREGFCVDEKDKAQMKLVRDTANEIAAFLRTRGNGGDRSAANLYSAVGHSASAHVKAKPGKKK